MDETQADHLRAYGVAYHALEEGIKVEWLLNYKGGSFLMDYYPEIEKYCNLRGVTCKVLSESKANAIYEKISRSNMERILLEVAPKIAVYAPPFAEPWDDAVRLALEYAGIHYDVIWDPEVLAGVLKEYDWIHLHHEDFTGQYGKFYASYRNAPWFKRQVKYNKKMAKRLGFKKVWQLKHAVAEKFREYVENGGFLFAMCSATETIDIALAAQGIDIVPLLDGDGVTPNCNSLLDYSRTFAFTGFKVDLNPYRYRHSDIDVTQEAYRRGPKTYFKLNNFSAKYDPIPTMLTQCHTKWLKEFLGQTTGFRRDLLKKDVIVLADVPGTEEVKYIYVDYNKGFVSFYGGHDPEDYAHYVGEKPTDLKLHKNSPGYRLILNNVLFPAARVNKLKT